MTEELKPSIQPAVEMHPAPNERVAIQSVKRVFNRWLAVGAGLCFLIVVGTASAFWFKGQGDRSGDGLAKLTVTTDEPTPSPTITPTPVPTGSLSGEVKGGYYNRAIGDASVHLKNDQKDYSGSTNKDGVFTINSIEYGTYQVVVTHAEYTFPTSPLTIDSASSQMPQPISGQLTHPKATSVNVATFSDTNGNAIRENNETTITAYYSVTKKVGSKWEAKYSFNTTETSSYDFKLEEMGEYAITILHKTFYEPTNATQTVVVDGYGGQKDFYFGLRPTASERNLRVFVFNDKNENGQQDGDEEHVHYQAVEIRNNSTGSSYREAVPPEGTLAHALDFGEYTATLVPESSSWANSFKITKGSVGFPIQAGSNNDTNISLGAHKLY